MNFTSSANYDPNAALINSFGYSPAAGQMFFSNSVVYTAPVVNPPAFQQFTAITPQLVNTMRVSNLSDFSLELNAGTPDGFRQIFYTGTYANDLELMTQLANQLNESMQVVNPLPGLINYAMSLEPLPTTITKWGPLSGGNALGVDPSDGDLIRKCTLLISISPCHIYIHPYLILFLANLPQVVLLGVSWTDAADDDTITNAVTDLFKKFDKYVASKKKTNPFKYLNYAHETQKPIKGYGAANVKKLKAVSKKYDPSGMFQKLVPGGFKL